MSPDTVWPSCDISWSLSSIPLLLAHQFLAHCSISHYFLFAPCFSLSLQITCFTYYPKTISEFMWSLLPQIVAAFDEYAYDYISSMIHPIDNYICIGTDRLVATPALLEGVMRIAHKILSDKNQDVEAQYASKIVETLFAAVRTAEQ